MAWQPAATVYRDVTRAALLGLGVNLALAAIKLVAGAVAGSFALVSDGFHSLSDVFTSVVVLFALQVAQRPPDKEHPYGHSRAEAIAASNVALVIMLSAVAIGWEALHRFGIEHAPPPLWALWVAAANVVIKEALYRNKVRVGRRTASRAIIANAWDHRTDALCSLAVLVGLAAGRFGGESYHWADEAAALVIVMVIFWSGLVLFRTGASELMDVQAEAGLLAEIRQAAGSVEKVERVETLWVRKSGIEYFADIHIEVDPHMTVAEGHRIGHLVKDQLLERFPMLRDVLVHLEPAGQRDARA